ncbi:hypothetical protein LEP1GSC040_1366 [Leptospira santarosai str. 2000030832]|nr:hypothetical protein LEP1GSC040_1366 [Leptospira santarosai str. 2000030832]
MGFYSRKTILYSNDIRAIRECECDFEITGESHYKPIFTERKTAISCGNSIVELLSLDFIKAPLLKILLEICLRYFRYKPFLEYG